MCLRAASSHWRGQYMSLRAAISHWRGQYMSLRAASSHWRGQYMSLRATSSHWRGQYMSLRAACSHWRGKEVSHLYFKYFIHKAPAAPPSIALSIQFIPTHVYLTHVLILSSHLLLLRWFLPWFRVKFSTRLCFIKSGTCLGHQCCLMQLITVVNDKKDKSCVR